MAVTLNLRKMAVKNTNGDYVLFDAVTQSNREEIEAVKDEALTSINNVLDTIPDDYTTVVEKVEELERTFSRISEQAIDEIVGF